jgi:threonine dehydratase
MCGAIAQAAILHTLHRIDQGRGCSHTRRHNCTHTQVLTSSSIDALAGLHILFKAEMFQRSGSFKIRGATNAVLSLTDTEAQAGVITHR